MRNGWKRLVFLSMIAAIFATGCGKNHPSSREEESDDGRLNVVTTLFPYYDFVRQIAGERVHLSMVVPAGMDSHSFEPTPADMITIQNADVLVCNGGAMEHWLTNVLEAIEPSGMTVVTGMDQVSAVREILVEGMEEEHNHEAEEAHDHDQEMEYDEHIWTSPVNAMKLVEGIRDALCDADPDHALEYASNTETYLQKLTDLDRRLQQVTANSRRNMIIVGDKFPFRYLADEYGLLYRAAFSGCSTDTEPSAQTIAYLIDQMRSERIPVIYYLELSSRRVSEIIAEETGAEPLLLHSCHNVTRREFDSGVTYLDLMESNIENLRKGLDE